MFVQIDGNSLTYEQIHQVIYEGYSVKISDHALENIKRSRALVEDSITNNKVIYGVNTGFGKFSDTVISKDDLADLQINLIRSHAVPVEYKENPDEFVRLVIEEMIPRVAEENLAEFCDVFCEEGVFTVEQSEQILEAGKVYGLKPKIHG